MVLDEMGESSISGGPTRREVLAQRRMRRRRRRIGRRLRVAEMIGMAVAALAVLVAGAVIAGPRFLPYQALVVRSGSMAPTIPTGSVVFYRHEAAGAVQPGQVILFAEPGEPGIWVTHRVVAVRSGSDGRYFVTKGDANAVPDAWRVPARGSGWVAVFHVPYIGYVLADVGSKWGRLILITIPAIALGLLLLSENLQPGRRRRGAHSAQRGVAAEGGGVGPQPAT